MDYSRCWVPCVDSLWERCTWEFEFVVPKTLAYQDDQEEEEEEGRDQPQQDDQEEDEDDDDEDGEDESEVVAICSGDLIEQVSQERSGGGKGR